MLWKRLPADVKAGNTVSEPLEWCGSSGWQWVAEVTIVVAVSSQMVRAAVGGSGDRDDRDDRRGCGGS